MFKSIRKSLLLLAVLLIALPAWAVDYYFQNNSTSPILITTYTGTTKTVNNPDYVKGAYYLNNASPTSTQKLWQFLGFSAPVNSPPGTGSLIYDYDTDSAAVIIATTTSATGIKSATTTVNTSNATAPSAGQVLTATGPTAATWQLPELRGAVATSETSSPAGTFGFLNVTGTLPSDISDSNVPGINFSLTSSGSQSFGTVGTKLTLYQGYTGTGPSNALLVNNNVRNTAVSNIPGGYSNNGVYSIASNITNSCCTGSDEVGVYGAGLGYGGILIGNYGSGNAFMTGVGIGSYGIGGAIAGATYRVGGLFRVSDVSTFPTVNYSAALVADNGTSTADIFQARDNGALVFNIANGGAVNSTSTITGSTLYATTRLSPGYMGIYMTTTKFTPPTVALGGAGNLSAGVYKYKLVAQYSMPDSSYLVSGLSISPATITVGASGSVVVTKPTIPGDIPPANWIVFRTKANGNTYYYHSNFVYPNATTSFTDTLADASLTITVTSANASEGSAGESIYNDTGTLIYKDGHDNIFSGNWAGMEFMKNKFQSNSYFNIGIGGSSQKSLLTGDGNVSIGAYTLYDNVSGSGNITIGNYAGSYATGSNEFYVDNQDRGSNAGDKASALLYGTMAATPAGQQLTVNGALTANSVTSTGLTATRIPVVGTNGLLGDTPALTFDASSGIPTLNIGDFMSGGRASVYLNDTFSSGAASGGGIWFESNISGSVANDYPNLMFLRLKDTTLAANNNMSITLSVGCQSNSGLTGINGTSAGGCLGVSGRSMSDNNSSTTGLRTGVLGSAINSTSTGSAIGVVGFTVGMGTGEKIGVLGQVVKGSGDMNTASAAVYGRISGTLAAGVDPPAFGNSVVVADNSTYTTVPLFVGRSNDATVFQVDGAGKVSTPALTLTTGAAPTCDSTVRGTFWYTAGGAGVKDTVNVCAKDAGNAYAWRVIY